MEKKQWRYLRQASQLVCLFIFLALFRLTDFTGADTLPYAVNLIFRLDPLVGACVTLAAKTLINLLWPCLVLAALTLLLGRFFCGWVCPLGTLIDWVGISQGQPPFSLARLKFIKYALLCLVLVSALFSVQLLGFFDPFALLVRGLAFGIDPVFNFLVTGFFDGIYEQGPRGLSDITEPLFALLKSFVLPYKQSFFYLSALSFFLVAGILSLEFFGKWVWCRTLCPLGALLALMSKFSPLRRRPTKACKGCGKCQSDCPMEAFDDQGRLMTEECNLCMNCLEFCPDHISGFGFGLPRKIEPPKIGSVNISRRQVLTAGFLGVCLPLLLRTSAGSKETGNPWIRPPGALDEREFLARCVRCGECMKVCITNGLQPIGFEKGLENIFTPRLVPRLGYCEFNCTLCSQVCPTHAIEFLSLEKKHKFVMGMAWFDKNRCLPYAEKKACIVCEEHCPVHDKAIRFDEVEVRGPDNEPLWVKQPRVVKDRCIGCGICENVCPIPGDAAIRVMGRASEKSL